jgi:Collagen triple helix repeat (20 copies)
MKRIIRLFSVITLSLSVALWSCKGDQGLTGPIGTPGATGAAGPTGATGVAGAVGATGVAGATGTAGTNGTNGKDGNANVKATDFNILTTDWKNVDVAGIGTATAVASGAFQRLDVGIDATIVVLAYIKQGTTFTALPLTLVKDTDGSYERLSFGQQVGSVTFYYRRTSSILGSAAVLKPDTDISVRYVKLQATQGRLMEQRGVDLNNYDSVMSYLQNN